MLQKIREIVDIIKKEKKGKYYFKNITNSFITIISRSTFEINDRWFDNLLNITYDDEIKSKYSSDLHTVNKFEREEFYEIFNFQDEVNHLQQQLDICQDYIARFKESYKDFYLVIDSESNIITDYQHWFVTSIENLKDNLPQVDSYLRELKTLLKANPGYGILTEIRNLSDIQMPIKKAINIKRNDWRDFLQNEIQEYHFLQSVNKHYNQVYYELSSLFRLFKRLRKSNSKIIVGNAGTGKTHTLAHLINCVKEQGDIVIFLKPKQFNGDNIVLEEKLLQLLQVPKGYTLHEILDRINAFAYEKNKRCFIIIDALNETSNSTLGFSAIWRNHLQQFINHIGLFPNLYFVCTLRTSYIEQIWDIKPAHLVTINGFDTDDLPELCSKYFQYYKINVKNFGTADLDVFGVPLLLDLYCKLINENRADVIDINLNLDTYLKVFENYVAKVQQEVQKKLNLQMQKPIKKGFFQTSEQFFNNNNAVIEIDDFSNAFGDDEKTKRDNSIAQAVLEGYLIFIKDIVNTTDEIIKHTQQEVGGYLLATYLLEKYSLNELLENPSFIEKILDEHSSKPHQLRLDILKFLVAMRPEIIPNLNSIEGYILSWWFLYNGYLPELGSDIPNYLSAKYPAEESFEEVLNISSKHWFNRSSEFNFNFIAELFLKVDNAWGFDCTWTFYLYNNSTNIYDFINEKIKELKSENANLKDGLEAKFICLTTATTVRELRDLATVFLIEYGKKHPIELLELAEFSTNIIDTYVYERIVSSCYGVCLIMQNNDDFVKKILPEFAERFYQLQFASNPRFPVYNYIVIDSVKHIIDLAIWKAVYNLPENKIELLNNYKFSTTFEWTNPSADQQELIDHSNEMSWPEPIGMDFGIYTIPRLIDSEYNEDRNAIAHVYKRILELGYRVEDSIEFNDELFKDFYFGDDSFVSNGKVDRLGKKYSWKGFFDYAGFLLLNGRLDVFENYAGKRYYERLGDVDIDVSIPNKDYKLYQRIYSNSLINNRESNPDWHTEIKIDSIRPLFEFSFDAQEYIMLYGKVDDRIDEHYNTRSFLLVDAFFIQKNESFEKAKEKTNVLFDDWDVDNHRQNDRVSNMYFGELYWADNNFETEAMQVHVPTGEKVTIDRTIDIYDVFHHGFKHKDIGNKISETAEEKLYFDGEPTLVEYLWETDSKLLDGYSEYYPSIKMGKQLSLRVDPQTGYVLDSELNSCFHCVGFNEHYFSNDFNYMRSDLLRKYMNDNNLAILYQVKQHSYDEGNRQKRSMKYFILE